MTIFYFTLTVILFAIPFVFIVRVAEVIGEDFIYDWSLDLNENQRRYLKRLRRTLFVLAFIPVINIIVSILLLFIAFFPTLFISTPVD